MIFCLDNSKFVNHSVDPNSGTDEEHELNAITIRDIQPGEEITEDYTCAGPKKYLVRVTNRGDTTEVYKVALDGPSWIRAEETSITLQPNEYALVPIVAQLPATDETTKVTFKIGLHRFGKRVQ